MRVWIGVPSCWYHSLIGICESLTLCIPCDFVVTVYVYQQPLSQCLALVLWRMRFDVYIGVVRFAVRRQEKEQVVGPRTKTDTLFWSAYFPLNVTGIATSWRVTSSAAPKRGFPAQNIAVTNIQLPTQTQSLGSRTIRSRGREQTRG